MEGGFQVSTGVMVTPLSPRTHNNASSMMSMSILPKLAPTTIAVDAYYANSVRILNALLGVPSNSGRVWIGCEQNSP